MLADKCKKIAVQKFQSYQAIFCSLSRSELQWMQAKPSSRYNFLHSHVLIYPWGILRCSQHRWVINQLKCVLVQPWGLLPVGCAYTCTERHVGGKWTCRGLHSGMTHMQFTDRLWICSWWSHKIWCKDWNLKLQGKSQHLHHDPCWRCLTLIPTPILTPTLISTVRTS